MKNSCFFRKTSSSFPIKINFWTFRDFLLFLSHSTANLLNSAQFLNLETIFPKTHLCFEKPQNLKIFEKSYKFSRFLKEVCYVQQFILHSYFFLNKTISFFKKTQLLKVLRNFTDLVAFPRLIATNSVFKKNQVFFRKTNFFFVKKSTYERFDNFYYFVSFHVIFATLINFQKILFFQKMHHFLRKKWTFWEIVIFPPHSTTNFLILANSKKLEFSAKPNYFFYRIELLNVLRVFTVSVAFFCIFATFSKFSKTGKISKNPFLFHNKPKIWTCLEVVLFRSHSTVIYYIYQFLKNWKKTPKTQLCFKKTQNLNVLRILIFRTHSTLILLPLAICKETMFYYWKIQLF